MSKKLIFKKKTEIINNRERTVIQSLSYTINDENKVIDTKYGKVTANDIKSKNKVKTSMGKDAYIIEESFIDKYRRMKKLAQTIPLKDIGYIITSTGLNKNSIVGESGCGSGGVSCFIANIVKEVRSYDINDDNIKKTQDNIKFLNLNNIKLKKHDMYNDFLDVDDNYFDLFILDLPEPINAFDNVFSKVKVGGFIISYSPSITQNLKLINFLKAKENIQQIKTMEIIHRPWHLNNNVAKPLELDINHSGFLTLIRKLNDIND